LCCIKDITGYTWEGFKNKHRKTQIIFKSHNSSSRGKIKTLKICEGIKKLYHPEM
jgi:hypothetical protein